MNIYRTVTQRTKKTEGQKVKASQNPSSYGNGDKTNIPTTSRSQRLHRTKFVGRRISHEWVEDEGHRKWYDGTVMGVESGKDGSPDAVYEVMYDGDEELYSIDHLHTDFQSASVKFIDLM
ncbi:uncharacterized protein LOC117344934 [Pecten maximus]|uniref:uncharacterized protein LOC117320440 n=1 Tax=Pecten maximus TaxID=6579 RepID=UPI001457F2B3|nr:uncharacterized protein LOC117320440 [Pecten maximus]XP_033733215.1 uncharacterized protein LOC117322419 [Pecten maximus]XP_033763711.1 uncharacterized protein LOC117344934 [Pecten maximus]